jgi:Zn-dependent M28 family amino/carboxypeptidase
MKTKSGLFILLASIVGFFFLLVAALYLFVYRPIVVNEKFFDSNQVSFIKVNPLESELQKHVEFLTQIRPFRSVDHVDSLNVAADYISAELKKMGYEPEEQKYFHKNQEFKNIIVKIKSTNSTNANQIIVVGAHYDVCGEQSGADDNASGVSGLLELARMIKQNPQFESAYSIHLVFYTLEEPPTYDTEFMGSYIHAKSLAEKKFDVKLMLSLEMIGFFSDQENSQTFPISLLKLDYPTVGNFIALVSNLNNRDLVREVKSAMRAASDLPIFSINAPKSIPGIDFSDHRSYWNFGFSNAMMLTDTSFYRNPNYHLPTDTPATLDYKRMGGVVAGVYGVVSLIK